MGIIRMRVTRGTSVPLERTVLSGVHACRSECGGLESHTPTQHTCDINVYLAFSYSSALWTEIHATGELIHDRHQ